jgi:isopenicillin-N N-acyltransferase like protein
VIVEHVLPPAEPAERGEEFGAAHAAAVRTTVDRYAELFADAAGAKTVDLRPLGQDALTAIERHAPTAAAEIRGIAVGAELEPWAVAALNARTEILARLGCAARGECSTIVALGRAGTAPATIQTWDWLWLRPGAPCDPHANRQVVSEPATEETAA